MLTGEYLVLSGAMALAVPTKLGQAMKVRTKPGEEVINWKANEMGKPWFQAVISSSDWTIRQTSDPPIAGFLARLLKAAFELNAEYPVHGSTIEVRTDLEFRAGWGLGSSSSLISNVAYWFKVDPFKLMERVTNGSGCDIAAARCDGPLVYRLKEGRPDYREVMFDPPFRSNLYFVYLGEKSDSRQSVDRFLKAPTPGIDAVERCSRITDGILKAATLEEMEKYMVQHEELLSSILETGKVSEIRFPDFGGKMKSLGAWGGDFILVTWKGKRLDLEKYFKGKGLETIFAYDELVL